MGLFKGLFNKKESGENKEENVIPWIPLDVLSQIDEIKRKSRTKTQVIFKHSTSCGVSRMVLNTFKSNYTFSTEQLDLYYLDLLSYREVSNQIAAEFQVIHQSPQLLVIKNDVVVFNASHGEINEVDLAQFI